MDKVNKMNKNGQLMYKKWTEKGKMEKEIDKMNKNRQKL